MLTELLLHFTALPTWTQIVVAGGCFQLLMFALLGAAERISGRIRL